MMPMGMMRNMPLAMRQMQRQFGQQQPMGGSAPYAAFPTTGGQFGFGTGLGGMSNRGPVAPNGFPIDPRTGQAFDIQGSLNQMADPNAYRQQVTSQINAMGGPSAMGGK